VIKDEGNDGVEIIMVNVIPPDHVDDLPVVEPNQHDDVPVPVLVDEDEDPEEEEFKEEEEPQEEEDDMVVDIQEDDNKPKPEDVIEVEDTVEFEDETVPASVHETAHALVEKKRKAKDEYYGKLILDLGHEVRSSVKVGMAAMENSVKKLSNAKEEKAKCKNLKKELEEARGFVFEERPNEANDVPVEDEKSPSSEIMPPKSAPLTQAIVRQMIEESIDDAIAAERARYANAGNDARESGPLRGQDVAPVVRECTFAGFMKCNPIIFHESAKIKAYIRELSDNTRNNQKQWNARAMTTSPTEKKVSSGTLPVCEHCFIRHDGPCTIKCHKCRKVGHKSRYCKKKSVTTGANDQPVWTCYDCREQGHTRKRCPKKVKQEETEEVCGRAYAIKDAEPQGPNMVTGTFLLNNRYASVLFDSRSDRSFVDTSFSSMLDIDPVKINASYEIELADGRIVSTNTVLKCFTLNLVNHLVETYAD
nr:reverse transcriptase domain-containing protein [Tanacetum cinerariifolium]